MNDLSKIIVSAFHPKFADAISETLSEAKARGLSVGLQSGIRDAAKQQALYELGRTVKNPDGFDPKKKPLGNIITNAEGWESWHNYGLAADIVFKDPKGNWTWNKTPEQWEELAQVAQLFGLEWGGSWKMKDYPHFQMRGKLLSVGQAKKILMEKGLDGVWAMV